MISSFRSLLPASLKCALVAAALAGGIAQAQAFDDEDDYEDETPAPMAEYAPPAPHARAHWVPGHWEWRGSDRFWAAGHYVRVAAPPPRPWPGQWGWDNGSNWNRRDWRPY